MTATELRPGGGRALRAHGLPPDQIMPLSLERLRLRLRGTVELPPEPAATVLLRMAYACGDPELLHDVVIGGDAVAATVQALRGAATVVCDVAMVAAGVRRLATRGGSAILVSGVGARDGGNSSGTVLLTAETRTALEASTRTAQGLVALAAHWAGAVVVIGNAPTALLACLDALADGAPRPAALIATPCGLVAAAEAKQLLIDTAPLPFITVRGTRGGSAVAAAALNACAQLAHDHTPR